VSLLLIICSCRISL